MSRLAFILILALPLFAEGQSATVAEQYLLSAVNQERTSHNLSPVRLDAALHLAARLHAQRMAAHGTISHRFAGEPELSARGFAAGAHFERITENVAEGPTVLILHDAWMRSPGHRDNIVDPTVDRVGISVIAHGGQLYAVEDFERSVPSLSLQQQESAVAFQLEEAGLELVPGADARRSCGMDSGYAGSEQPAFIVRYTTGDISQLPGALKTRLAKGQEHRAAVGACTGSKNSSFSSYSLAVVLYP